FDQVLDLHLAFRLLVAALDHHAGRAAPVGVFELRPHLARTEIKLGADAAIAQGRDHFLVIGDAFAVEHRDDDGAGLGLGLDLAEMLQRRHQSRHADRKSRPPPPLAPKPRHHSILTAVAYRAQTNWSARVVLSLESQIHFEDWAGVILKAANHGSINADAFASVSGCFGNMSDFGKFVRAVLPYRVVAKVLRKLLCESNVVIELTSGIKLHVG